MAGAIEAFRDFVHATGIPVVSTLKGLGAVPTDEPAFLGMMGMHGTRAANLAIQASDLLICIGARFDDRATGTPGWLRAARERDPHGYRPGRDRQAARAPTSV